jgi:Na+/proline symporter
MNTPIVLADLYGGLLVIVGLTAFKKNYLKSLFEELAKSEGLLWMAGLFTFALGVVSLALYSTWSSNWEVLITIAGWLALLKGIFLTLFGKTAIKFYRKMIKGSMPAIIGVIAVILGVVFLYYGLMG